MASDPQTWTELKASLAEWLNRSDLTSKIPEFIAFAERKFNRTLITPERETTATLTATSSVALPSDFWEMRALHIEADPRVRLEQVTPNVLRSAYSSDTTGKPRAYALIGANIILGPAPDSAYSLTIDYYQTIPALASGQATNWLLTAHPDLYMYGSLLQAEAYVWNDDRLGLWKAAHDEVLAEIMQAGNRKRYAGAPVRLRNPIRGRV